MVGRRQLHAVGLVPALLFPIAGCGPDNPLGREAVSGRVTLDGQPLDEGRIEFEPRADRGIRSGALIREGRYEIPAEKGLPPGAYLVRIYAPRGGPEVDPNAPPGPAPPGAPAAVERIPAEYNTGSGEIVEVTASGPNRFDYEIETGASGENGP